MHACCMSHRARMHVVRVSVYACSDDSSTHACRPVQDTGLPFVIQEDEKAHQLQSFIREDSCRALLAHSACMIGTYS